MKAKQKHWFEISVYILTDALGEWFESARCDGSLSKWQPTKEAVEKPIKTFSKLDDAIKWGKEQDYKKFKIIKLENPIGKSCEYQQSIVFQWDNRVKSI